MVIAGPSGVGKSTVVAALAKEMPFHFSVSVTTRSRRPDETEGVDYRFVDEETFKEMVREEALLEWAEYAGEYYGTPLQPVIDQLESGTDVMLNIEIHGATQVKRRRPEAILIFISPPSIEELERRLRGRGDTEDEALNKRLTIAMWELDIATERFDHIVVNDSVQRAVDEISRILSSVPDERPS